MALIGHLRVANECKVALATLTAASSGPIPKAPGSAGGYLLLDDVKFDLCDPTSNQSQRIGRIM